MSVYTLRMPKAASTLKNFHIFEAKLGDGRGCICLPKSLCQKALTSDTTAVEQYMCLNEAKMRVKVADKGREICGACLAALYGDEDQQ